MYSFDSSHYPNLLFGAYIFGGPTLHKRNPSLLFRNFTNRTDGACPAIRESARHCAPDAAWVNPDQDAGGRPSGAGLDEQAFSSAARQGRWAQPGMRDFDRPLESSGVADAKLIGIAMQEGRYVPAVTLCSSARRARETLEAIAEHADTGRVFFRDDLYTSDASGYLAIIRDNGAHSPLLVIGHNPMLEDLAMALAPMAMASPDRCSPWDFRPRAWRSSAWIRVLITPQPAVVFWKSFSRPPLYKSNLCFAVSRGQAAKQLRMRIRLP